MQPQTLIHRDATGDGWNLHIGPWPGRKIPSLVAHACDGDPRRSSYFGDREHIRRIMGEYRHTHDRYATGWTDDGLAYMAGLACSLNKPRDNESPFLYFA